MVAGRESPRAFYFPNRRITISIGDHSLAATQLQDSNHTGAKGVLVAHPGRQHSYELAFALHQGGLLAQYATCFYWNSNSILSKSLSCLSSLSANVMLRLKGRQKAGLPAERVTTQPFPEVAYVLSTRLGLSRSRVKDILAWRNEHFDSFVANLAARINPAAVTCYDSCALRSFHRAETIGALRVLDQSIGHIRSGLKILKQEVELSPEFADGEDISVPDGLSERCTEEALLADIVLAGSEYVKGTLVAHSVPSPKVTVAPYGVDTVRFVPRAD